MPLISLRRIHRLTYRVIATTVALSLLSMPVTYRGGADAAHAHTIFQLWGDVRIGSFTHHVAGTDHVDREPWEPARGSPTGTSTGAVELDQDAPVAGSAFTPSVRLDGITDAPIAPPPR